MSSAPQPHHQASSCSASQRLPFGVLRMLGDLQDRLRRLSADMVSGLASCRTGVSKDRKPDRHSQYLTRASFCSTATEVKHRSTPEVPSDRNSRKPSGVDLAYRAIQLTRGMRSCRLISSTGCELVSTKTGFERESISCQPRGRAHPYGSASRDQVPKPPMRDPWRLCKAVALFVIASASLPGSDRRQFERNV